MTLVAAPISTLPPCGGALPCNANGNFTFDTSLDLMACVFRVPKTGTIAKVHYRINSVSTPVATHQISLQTVSATTGLPNGIGSLYGSSTAITVDASTYAGATNYTAAVNCTGATAGDLVALVFDLSALTSGSFTQRQFVGIPSIWGDPRSSGRNVAFPYGVFSTTGSTAKDGAYFSFSSWGLEYSGTTYTPIANYFNGGVGTGIGTTATNSGTTRVGNIFRPVTPRRAIGIWAQATLSGDVLFRLRKQSDDSILATATVDKDQIGGTTELPLFFTFDSGTAVTLVVATDYYITLEGNDATGGVLGGISSLPAAAATDWFPGGQTCYAVTYNAGYTSTTTSRYSIGLITDQEDDGTGGSGGGRLIGGSLAG